MLFKLKNKLVVVLAIIASALFLAGSIFLFSNRAGAELGSLDSATIASLQDNYLVGERLVVPQTAKISVGSKEYDATEVYLYTASGNALNVQEYVFTGEGVYKLVYSAVTPEGEVVTAEKSFTVSKKVYDGSLTKVENVSFLKTISQNIESENKTSGLSVSIPVDDMFKWNNVIDLKETGLNIPFLSFLPYQFSPVNKVNGVIQDQARFIYVRLTDVYDANKYVDIEVEYLKAGRNYNIPNQMPSFQAAAVGQSMSSLTTELGGTKANGRILTFTEPDLMINGSTSYKYYASYSEHPGNPSVGDVTENGQLIDLFYDVTTNQVRVSEATVAGAVEKVLVNDLDAKTLYTNNAFEGFTNGEVYLSIFCQKYSDVKVNMEIASIGTLSGDELHNPISVDDKAPVIELDVSEDQIKNGIFVPMGQRVDVVDAKFLDHNLAYSNVSVSYQGAPYTINGNSFLPLSTGDYLITYYAKDAFNNESIVEITYKSIDCSANGNKLISYDLGEDNISTVYAGKELTLPEYQVASNNNYIDVKIFAYFDGDLSNKIEINPETRKLFVENVGKYHVVFEMSDFIESVTAEYTFNSQAGSDVSWTDVALPKYVIKGAKYSFDPVYANVYTKTRPSQVEAKYFISKDGGSFESVANYADLQITASNTVQFKYVYGTDEITSNVLDVVDVDFTKTALSTPSYFVGNGIVSEEYGSNGFALVTEEDKDVPSTGVVSADFVNVLSLSTFSINFNIPDTMRNVGYVKFIITDYLDTSNSLTITYSQQGSGYLVELSNGRSTSAKAAFYGTNFVLSFKANSNEFNDQTAGSVSWDNNFKGDRILFSFELGGIVASGNEGVTKAGIVISNMLGTPMNKQNRDNQAPFIGYDTTYMGTQVKNAKVTISALEGSDLFTPTYYGNDAALLSVTDVDNNPIKTVDGLIAEELDATRSYDFILSELGEIVVTYSYKDQKNANNVIYGSYSIYVADNVKPSIAIADGYNELTVVKAKLGDLITAKNFTYSDNNDEKKDLVAYVYVIDPFYHMYDLIDNGIEIDDMKFECEYYGVYTVLYYVEDISGNFVIASYKVFVQ